MMDLDEAIHHCEEVAEEQEKLYRLCPASESGMFHCDGTKDCITLKNGKNKGCQKCADEHRQLAEWLKELKAYKEQSGDAISRQAVLNIIRFEDKWLLDAKEHNVDTKLAFWAIKSKISEMPSITPQQRTGRWILTHRNEVNTYVCSECNNEPLLIGESYPIFKLSDYCPYCGAKMEVKK